MKDAFTYSLYREILQNLNEAGYIARHIDGEAYKGKCLYLRHDVDTDILGVLPMAQVEHEEKLVSTWYFLLDSPIYNMFSTEVSSIIDQLVDMGHMVGFHVDGERFKSISEIREILDKAMDIADIYDIHTLSKTFSFHKPNPNFLSQDISMGGGYTNAYQPRYFGYSEDIVYVSDSNRREFWKEDRLSAALDGNRNLTLLTHPIWWHNNSLTSDETFDYVGENVGGYRVKQCLAETAKRYAGYTQRGWARC